MTPTRSSSCSNSSIRRIDAPLAHVYSKVRSAIRSIFKASTEDKEIKPGREDIFLVSYPRSGNTWVRTIIAHLMFGDHLTSLSDLDVLVPDVYNGLRSIPGDQTFRVIKTHEPFPQRQHWKSNDYDKIIYLVRDPLDVARSFYTFVRDVWKDDMAIDDYVNDFMSGSLWPCSWGEHVLSWLKRSGDHDILLLRYEDLQTSPTTEILRIAEFIDTPVTKDEAQDIRNRCSKENMIELEKKGSIVDDDYEFVSRTEKRQTKEAFTDEHYAQIEMSFMEARSATGYKTTD